MLAILSLIALTITIGYFVMLGSTLVFGVIDKQGGNTTDNRIVALILIAGLLIIPLIGVIASFGKH